MLLKKLPLPPFSDSVIPILITIANHSEDKIKNVKVFDRDYKKQTALKYDSPAGSVDYEDILAELNSSGINIDKTALTVAPISINDKSWKIKNQLPCTAIITLRSITSQRLDKVLVFEPKGGDKDNKAEDEYECEFTHMDNIFLEHIAPKTMILIRLYPKPKSSKKTPSHKDLGLPFIVKIKNLTDEKLYGIQLLDYNHQDQRKVEYSMGVTGVEYEDFLQMLKNQEVVISTTLLMADCDYNKFVRRQISSTIIPASIKSENEDWAHGLPITPTIDPMHNFSDRVIIKKEFTLSHFNNLIFDFLMPETDIRLNLYPKRITEHDSFWEESGEPTPDGKE